MKDSFGIEKNFEEWTSHEWSGNPNLGLKAMVKTYNGVYHAHKLNVWIWGKENDAHHLPPPADPDYVFGALNYTVSDTPNSSYSYTGLCVDCFTFEDAIRYIESKNLTR